MTSMLVGAMAPMLLAAPVLATGPTGSVIFDNSPAVLPGNLPSVGFEATSTSEWGTGVSFAGSRRALTTVVVTMSTWALHSTYPAMPAGGWTHPITLNLYAIDGTAPGTLIRTITQTFAIPWRPEADPNCPGTAWKASDGNCYNGMAFNITFDLGGQVVPDSVIVGVAYNTSDYGAAPLRSSTPAGGPYDSLNVATFPGTGDGNTATPALVGSLTSPLGTYLDSLWAGAYGDGGAITGTFRLDPVSWGGYQPAIQVSALSVCTPTGFSRDGIDLTAAQIGGAVTGALDATGCNIGAYNPTSVSGATISGANYFGIVVDNSAVNVFNSTVRNIGETPLNGAQHGIGIYYTGAGAIGTISGNTVSHYQKNGIVATTNAKVSITGNTVIGEGRVDYIAQNGIQVSSGASATVTGNIIKDNYYTPKSYTACGLLLYQAGGVRVGANTYSGNEVKQCNAGKGGGQFNP
ncbi:MAG: right-handed parallel beta-helix repeat-containing protein [Candidatus Limnocylindrales bacterium]